MIKEHKKEYTKKDYDFFMESFDETPSIPLVAFHPFQCPVAITDIYTVEETTQDYSVFSLLILRLFDIGFKDAQQIASISGMSTETVDTYIKKEIFGFQHIDSKTLKLTELGKKTLEENKNGGDTVKSHEMFKAVRRIHVDAVTGTIIPSYLEREFVDNVTPNSNLGDFILPRKDVALDEKFCEELKDRLSEYVDSDYISNADIIDIITDIKSVKIFYRWAYLVKFEGMRYPMIVVYGRKSVDKVNIKSNVEGDYNKDVIVPIAISKTDNKYLERNGISFEKVIEREDEFFEYLLEKTSEMTLGVPCFEESLASSEENEDETAFEESEANK